MKRLLISIFSFVMAMNLVFAGGLVTNTNQSAAWARMLVRDASTSIDAVYFNPAGLTKLSDGLHISLSNQSIFQDRSITNSLFTSKEWKGSVSAPVFPNFYAAYKVKKFVFSLGFTPIGGGGSASFDNGIPMIELLVGQLPLAFSALGANGGYSYKAQFEGSSVYLGIQGGVSYAINDMISIYAGARYVMAKNGYTGKIDNISLTSANPNMQLLTNETLTGAATQATNAGNGLQPIIDGGGGSLTFAQAQGAAIIDATQRAQLEGGLLSFGYSQAQIDAMSISVAQGTYLGVANNLSIGAANLADKELDVEQTGNGITPIIGANLSFMEDKLNIGIKYEFKTNMEVKNNTTKDVMVSLTETMYPDGKTYNADIPAMLSLGLNYKVTDKFSTQIGYHTYFDKKAGWAEKPDPTDDTKTVGTIDKNYWELGLGFEYKITEKILLSTGYLRANTGVNAYYQSDMSYSLSSNTFAFGGAYTINDKISINLGGYKTMYNDATVKNPPTAPYSQTYKKSNFAVAIGLDLAFGGK